MNIERNIPLPTLRTRSVGPGAPMKYNWDQMKVDDSFYIKCDKSKAQVLATTLLSCARKYAKNRGYNYDYVTRRDENGVRIWRVK